MGGAVQWCGDNPRSNVTSNFEVDRVRSITHTRDCRRREGGWMIVEDILGMDRFNRAVQEKETG